jgi:DNA-binding MarR family transcriptional regulator
VASSSSGRPLLSKASARTTKKLKKGSIEIADPAPGGNPGIEPTRFGAWRHFVESHGLIVRLLEQDLVEACGLPIAWYQVLLLLNEAPEQRLALQELNETVTLSQSAVSRIVDKMESAGLVRREQSDFDRRSVYAVLTAQGRKKFAAAAPVHGEGIAKYFTDGLTDSEAKVLERVLARVHEGGRTAVRSRERG